MKNKTAEILKCRIIDYLLQIHPNIIIGNEIMFGQNRNVVDLLAILNNSIIAIEIKSKDDNLIRLPLQIEEYSKVYDKIYVFCSPEKIKRIEDIIKSKTIGIYEISDNKICMYKNTPINRNTLKEDMLASIPASYLRKVFHLNHHMDSDITRQFLLAMSKQKIHDALLNFYKEKISSSFILYKNDRGKISLVDDLSILSKESLII